MWAQQQQQQQPSLLLRQQPYAAGPNFQTTGGSFS
jgi:hypothetical protein